MNDDRSYDFLNALTPKDERELMKVLKKYPALDRSAQNRIIKKCEEKMNMNNKANNTNNNEVNSLEVINKTPWYRSGAFQAAAAVVLIAGIGAAGFAGLKKMSSNNEDIDTPPILSPVSTVTATGTGTSAEAPTDSTATTPVDDVTPGEPADVSGEPVVSNGFALSDYTIYANCIDIMKSGDTNNVFSISGSPYFTSYDDTYIALCDIIGDSRPEMLVYFGDKLCAVIGNRVGMIGEDQASIYWDCLDGNDDTSCFFEGNYYCRTTDFGSQLDLPGDIQVRSYTQYVGDDSINADCDNIVYDYVDGTTYYYHFTDTDGYNEFLEYARTRYDENGSYTPSEKFAITEEKANEIIAKYTPMAVKPGRVALSAIPE